MDGIHSALLNSLNILLFTCGSIRPKACNFIQKRTLAHVFSCEFCEISKNTFSTEHLWATDS